ncbi:hypothetical protein BGZ83_011299 [Gryganskiella cystojenkinii]|nr:hypothetical protein BGZ83_011299 [Gryganskiella cystojenkinii]
MCCGQHITQVLEGLPLEQICKCDDDFDSEKKWQIPPREVITAVAPMINPNLTSTPTQTELAQPSPRYPLPLSKISSTSATVAAVRMAQQAAALEELRRIKQRKEQQLKEANESALQKLLHGLSEATPTFPPKSTDTDA